MNLKDILFTTKNINTKQFFAAFITVVVVYFLPFVITGVVVGVINPQNPKEATGLFFEGSFVIGLTSVWVILTFLFFLWVLYKYFKHLLSKTY